MQNADSNETKDASPTAGEASPSVPTPAPTKPKVEIRDVTPEGASATVSKIKYEQSFILDYVDADGKRWHGEFTCKRLTIGDIARRGVEKARLNMGENVDIMTDEINHRIAHCIVSLVKFPEWFEPMNMYDLEILYAVYGRAVEFHNSFRR